MNMDSIGEMVMKWIGLSIPVARCNHSTIRTITHLFHYFRNSVRTMFSFNQTDQWAQCSIVEIAKNVFSHLWVGLRHRLRAVQLAIYSVHEYFHLDAQGKQVTLHFNAHRITAYDEKWIELVWMNRCSISALPTEDEMQKCINAKKRKFCSFAFFKIGFWFSTTEHYLNESREDAVQA